MPVSVKTFATPAEAAAALSSDRSARFIGGGTLVMRALNEGDVAISTIVRLQDRGLSQIRATGARVTIGAGVTLAQILRERELAFLHATARSIGGPAVRTMATVGGNLYRPLARSAISTVALLALDATVSVQGGFGARDMAIEEFLAGRDRAAGALVTQRLLPNAPRNPRRSAIARSRASSRRAPRSISIAAHVPNVGGRVSGRAHRLWRDGADRDPRQGGRTRARRPDARRVRASPPRSRPRRRGPRRRPTRSPAPGIGAKSSACICAGCCSAAAEERLTMAKTAAAIPTQRPRGRGLRRRRRQSARPRCARSVGDVSPKFGCGQGGCGACTVLIDGERAPLLPDARRERRRPIGRDRGRPEERPRAASAADGVHGQFRRPMRLLHAGHADGRQGADRPQSLADAAQEVVEAISGNICRCTGYEPIINAILAVAAGGGAKRA